MDNLSAYKVEACERIQACGASVLYLPPYSPDINAIEKAWFNSNMAFARPPTALTAAALEIAVEELLPTISAQDTTAWFRLRYQDYTCEEVLWVELLPLGLVVFGFGQPASSHDDLTAMKKSE